MPSARGGPACCPAAVAYQARPPGRVMGAKIKVGAVARLPGSAVPCAVEVRCSPGARGQAGCGCH